MSPRERSRQGGDAWLDLGLAVVLLLASASWATYLVGSASTADLVLCMVFLLGSGSFACQGAVGLRERALSGR